MQYTLTLSTTILPTFFDYLNAIYQVLSFFFFFHFFLNVILVQKYIMSLFYLIYFQC